MSWELVVGAVAGIGWRALAWPVVRDAWRRWRDRREEAARRALPAARALPGRRGPAPDTIERITDFGARARVDRPRGGAIGQRPQTTSTEGNPFPQPRDRDDA